MAQRFGLGKSRSESVPETSAEKVQGALGIPKEISAGGGPHKKGGGAELEGSE